MDLKIMASVVFWEARRVFLTDTELVLSKAAEPALVSASILLHDILNVFEDKQHAEEGAEGEHVLVLRTDACSASFGRTYILRMHDSEKFNEWFPFLQRRVEEARRRHDEELAVEGLSSIQKGIYRSRQAIRRRLSSIAYQKFAAVLILLSFLCDVLEAELLPSSGDV